MLGKYHPHGDPSIYDALVRLAQDFSMRYPLVDGQGNFGSVDGDPAAAMRYTEARLTAHRRRAAGRHRQGDRRLRRQLRRHRRSSPRSCPAKLPNLLINGSSGIAVGMATNIPPHNLSEIVDATVALIDNPELTVDDLCKHVTGPGLPDRRHDLPLREARNALTGEWETVDAIRQTYAHGRGRVVMRAQAVFEEVRDDRTAIVVTELPYQVNKAALLEKIAELVKDDKRIDGISDLRDESDRDGMRIVIELKRDVNPHKVLNNLFKHTPMQQAFGINMLALVERAARRTLPLRSVLVQEYLDYRQRGHHPPDASSTSTRRQAPGPHPRRPQDRPRQPRRGHPDDPRVGRRDVARAEPHEAVRPLRAPGPARSSTCGSARLAALERKKIEDEYLEVIKLIAELEDMLANPAQILGIVRDELIELKRKYAASAGRRSRTTRAAR